MPFLLSVGKLVCSGSDDATLRVWKPQTGETLHVVTGTRLFFFVYQIDYLNLFSRWFTVELQMLNSVYEVAYAFYLQNFCHCCNLR